jgi:hypothetical protein
MELVETRGADFANARAVAHFFKPSSYDIYCIFGMQCQKEGSPVLTRNGTSVPGVPWYI